VAYGERFHVEPHKVNPPLGWWLRLAALDTAKAQRHAREMVEAYGAFKVSPDMRRIYDDFILTVTGHKDG